MSTRAVVSDQRPGLQAQRESVELSFSELVTRLRDLLGVRLVAYVGNVKNTRPVSDWAAGLRSPGAEDEARLRLAFQAARLLRERYEPATIQSWMLGSNPALDFEAPARYIRNEHPVDAARDVMAAANSFAFVG
ncbi:MULTISPECIES: hypothetical protein [unclassified Microbacterium]|uniref:hypothetical protein n=1 Tax=unclassified Microbacterium TaxID=2609290 RepID=UPI000CFD41F0|nr:MULTISPECIES: hypothetical protein [unclassified Microbacterium]PQZ55343.1 hypothetical protein CQ032_11595 [Microbacterium sp. MYb43]PQZ73956.1 hypothetical protein CQ031_16545 [Microbacterium sp. MYb40]PRB21123.1 hypothetical protein CQ040_09925 [Microbacterium sp. MYb54]PRB26305.1 hypothetical protein CQ037_13360 [Microbacterium sp. MYb50]PRB66944.1 hypothetical protein CQ021_09615 [Microbacterium sp. MYb24]